MIELLSVAEMSRADAFAVAHGVAGETLMENAGAGVAREIARRWSPRPVVVLCGPGNNGGDGFVAARLLKRGGWPVRVALFGAREALKGDASAMAARWDGPIEGLSPDALTGAGLIVDALFGAGLARPLDGAALDTIRAAAGSGIPIVAVDVPSGVHGDGGAVLGGAAQAHVTVTFHCRKPGHLLLPGRGLCGETVVVDIGIPQAALSEIAPKQWENTPAVWGAAFRWPRLDGHKYDRGHTVVISGGIDATGAARLAARAALRAGSGLVTAASPVEALAVNAAALTSVMVRGFRDSNDLAGLLQDSRKNAIVVGPGNGLTAATRANVLAILATGRAAVLDADALTVFAEEPAALFAAIRGPCVLTPHAGEFARLFGQGGDKLERARSGAAVSGAVLLFKGADTVVAAPDGRAVINANAPPELATAGAGDVLSGLIGGLLAQGMPAFEAAAAGAWLHGETAASFGPGLIAEDLSEVLPAVLRKLRALLRNP
ncbi:MAG TPA: NAD(P)H-hydrate dehydratase [Candidatus Cybelea sp.]|nr:NAD(P)H-hydrate dehydratase [Candidatus Cybelea sp.]